MSEITGDGLAAIAAELGILQLGHPGLRQRAREVEDVASDEVQQACGRLLETVDAFRTRIGFGRGIAAPQLGIPLRLVALRVDGYPSILVNPSITWESDETFQLWDDCMSFPDLLVRLRRKSCISVACTTQGGETRSLEKLDRGMSELLQHEIDHLDGVLAVDRALDREAIVTRGVYRELEPHFLAQTAEAY